MHYRYKYLSPGYLGEFNNELTLNAKFHALSDMEFFNKESYNEDILFPQRVPKQGFFDEIVNLETIHYKIKLNSRFLDITECLKAISCNIENSHDVKLIRQYICHANRCLRYGRFQDIINMTPSLNSTQPFNLEIQVIKEAANINLLLSNELLVTVDNYLSLADKYIHSSYVSDREKISLLNQLIVTFYRYIRKGKQQLRVDDYAKVLYELLDQLSNDSISNQLCSSIGYRGLAMVSTFGFKMQNEFLYYAEKIAINIKPKREIEEIVVLENQYTLFQTMAKWHNQHGDLSKSLAYLKRMIQLDPLDSTGHSELGFQCLSMEQYEEAACAFKTAMELGPPGTGMNAYYYAQCLEKLGDEPNTVAMLHQSAKLDAQALSPLLDLMNYFLNKNDRKKATEIANHICNSPILMEQLEHNEVITIQNLIS